ncbi:MAG TPA: hypothetical protein VFV02_15735, partial [Acidimicrobiales bacterium]|nr:hypothetical protein [Acidimicrobiales bacterium]
GPLTEDDARMYIEERLTGIDLDGQILKQVVTHGQGWPLYLDLQGTRIERLVNRGAALESSDFGGPLVELVIRIMRDMEGWECDLLRASALTTSIDAVLLKAAIPEIRESQISQFLDSGFLGGGGQARTLNRALRESVIEADPELEDRWSSDYWVVVARRVLDHHRTWLNANDPALLTSAFTDGFDLAARFGLQPSWLPVAAERLFARGSWEVLRLPAGSPVVQRSPIRSLAVAAEAAALRATGDTSSAQTLMEEMISHVDSLQGTLRDYVAWQIVASAERAGAHAVVARFCDAMVTPVFRARGLIRMGRLAWIRSDLDRALALASAASRELQVAVEQQDDAVDFLKSVSVTHRSLVGWIRFTQGRFQEAAESFNQGLDIARSWGDEFFVASELAHLAITTSFGNAPDAPRYVKLAVRQSERVGAIRQLAQARTAEALAGVRDADLEGRLSRLSDVATGLVRAGDDVEVRLPLFARVVLLTRAGFLEEAREEAVKLGDLAKELSAHICLAEIGSWLSLAETVTGKEIVESWGDDLESVRRRWLEVGSGPSVVGSAF